MWVSLYSCSAPFRCVLDPSGPMFLSVKSRWCLPVCTEAGSGFSGSVGAGARVCVDLCGRLPSGASVCAGPALGESRSARAPGGTVSFLPSHNNVVPRAAVPHPPRAARSLGNQLGSGEETERADCVRSSTSPFCNHPSPGALTTEHRSDLPTEPTASKPAPGRAVAAAPSLDLGQILPVSGTQRRDHISHPVATAGPGHHHLLRQPWNLPPPPMTAPPSQWLG